MNRTRNSFRTTYVLSDAAEEYQRWIEETYTPTIFLHLTFPKSTYRKQAERILKSYFKRCGRLKYLKQHIRWFVWGGLQHQRGDSCYHFHVVGCLDDISKIDCMNTLLSRLKRLWITYGGGNQSIVTRYMVGAGGIFYSAMYHPDFWHYVTCPARIRRCRKHKCIYL